MNFTTLQGELTELVAKFLHRIQGVDNVTVGAKTAREVTDSGGIERYCGDSQYHALVQTLVAHITDVVRSQESKEAADRIKAWARSAEAVKEGPTNNEREQLISTELFKYSLVIMDSRYASRNVLVEARNAEDALAIADFNHCRSYDAEGKRTEAVYSIRAM